MTKEKTMSYYGHMKKLTREEYYQLAQEALAERINQLQKQREAVERYRNRKRRKK